MPDLNRANRMVADVDIRILSTMAPFLFFDTANTTTAGVSGESVYAMAKGSRRIAFQDPITATMSISAQVYPFKFFSLMSDGKIEAEAAYADTQVITATEAGKLTMTLPEGAEVVAGTVFVYPEDMFGDEASLIAGTWAENVFTATAADKIAVDAKFKVGYVVNRNVGVKKISFNNSKLPQDYYITMNTMDKDVMGNYAAFKMIAHKATIQRNFELSFSSEGDPASVELT